MYLNSGHIDPKMQTPLNLIINRLLLNNECFSSLDCIKLGYGSKIWGLYGSRNKKLAATNHIQLTYHELTRVETARFALSDSALLRMAF